MDRGVTMASMQTGNVLAIVQAGGAGGRMDVLTLERAKPALPFAGSYQLLDFPLSNLVNSRIDDVWLSVQYQASALGEQVLNGRPWDLDRTRGGLRLVVPQEGTRVDGRGGVRQGQRRRAVPAPRPDQDCRTGPGDRVERGSRLPARLPRRHPHPSREGRRRHHGHHRPGAGLRRGRPRARGRGGEPAGPGDLVRLQARRGDVHDGRRRGVRLPARRTDRGPRGAAP